MERSCPRCEVVLTLDNTRKGRLVCRPCLNAESRERQRKIALQNKDRVKDPNKTKDCSICKVNKPESNFDIKRMAGSNLKSACIRCSLLYIYRNRADRDGKEFTLSDDEFYGLIDRPCYMCDRFSYDFMTISGIDRVNSSIGYIPSNCLPCCTRCNIRKHVSSLEELYEWAKIFQDAYENRIPDVLAALTNL